MTDISKCGARYADSDHTCQRAAGYRADSQNVYSDPGGAHQSGGLYWTQKWVWPEPQSHQSGRVSSR